MNFHEIFPFGAYFGNSVKAVDSRSVHCDDSSGTRKGRGFPFRSF